MSRSSDTMALVQAALGDGHLPHVYSNGFIQLDLNGGSRLNFWGHSAIPRARVHTPIHDHVISFDSRVLLGDMTNILYHEIPGTLYDIWETRPQEGRQAILARTGKSTALGIDRLDRVRPGDGYHMPAFWFHQTITDQPTVTMVSNYVWPDGVHRPRVLVMSPDVPEEPEQDCAQMMSGAGALVDIIYEIIKEGT